MPQSQVDVRSTPPDTSGELDFLFQMTTDLVAIADFGGRFETLSPSWSRTLGYELDEMIDRPFIDFVHPDDVAKTKAAATRLVEAGGHLQNFENRYRCKDGTYRRLEWNVHAEPGRGKYYGVARDVTDARREQAAIKRQRDDLEAFAHMLAHDIRAPLRAVAGLLELIQRGGPGSERRGRSQLEIALGRVRAVDGMTMKLLAYCEAGQRAMDIRPLDMEGLVHEMILVQVDAGNCPPGTITTGELPPCHGDADLLRVVVANLLQNACKFVATEPEIHVWGTAHAGGLTYCVRDNGPGFDPASGPALWQALVRGAETRRVPGSGLGLATVHRIIEQHGGSVACRSVLGEGATFSFTIPS